VDTQAKRVADGLTSDSAIVAAATTGDRRVSRTR
jgi:hypothetical protein